MNSYKIICKCDIRPEGCIKVVPVFTDAVEALRDSFWGSGCKANSISITVEKIDDLREYLVDCVKS